MQVRRAGTFSAEFSDTLNTLLKKANPDLPEAAPQNPSAEVPIAETPKTEPVSQEISPELQEVINKALKKAKIYNSDQAVVTMDDGPSRGSPIVVPEAYTWQEDFEAFDGEVLFVVSPDGSVQRMNLKAREQQGGPRPGGY